MNRRKTKKVYCGDVAIGGDQPVSIQSMTNTDTRNADATVEQIARLAEEGCQIVRCAVPDMEAAEALGQIKKRIKLPVVADIHFDYRLAIEAIRQGADKIRINPGNIGERSRVEAVLTAAKERNIPIRVGVNSGSLEKDLVEKYGGVTPEGLAESALRTIIYVEEMGFDNLVVSMKASDVRFNQEAHRLIASKMNYPLHIGITEAGTAQRGTVKSAVGIGSLLLDGIGDTMRVSLTGDPCREVRLAKDILQALNLRHSAVNLISCPTCGRTKVDLEQIVTKVEELLKPIEKEMERRHLPGLTVAVMGCEVNGPGEAREADFGVACGKGKGVLIQKGEILQTIAEDNIPNELIQFIRQRVGL